jgi:sugar lactone lactonase YvrE
MAFDGAGNLHVTHWTGAATPGDTVARFDPAGTLLGTFGGGYNENPESIVFTASGNAYVAQADGTQDVLKFDPSGNLVGSFDVTIEHRGSDGVELAPDGCTLLYTSRDNNVLQYDVRGGVQLPSFNRLSLPGTAGFSLRLLPDGGLVVADLELIVRLDASGGLVRTYDVPGEPDLWIGLDAVADGTF